MVKRLMNFQCKGTHYETYNAGIYQLWLRKNSSEIDMTYVITYFLVEEEYIMTTLSVTEARANLYKLIDDTSLNHEPVIITGKRGNAVLLAEDDWNAINETLHLLSVPGMRETILAGMQESIDGAATELDW